MNLKKENEGKKSINENNIEKKTIDKDKSNSKTKANNKELIKNELNDFKENNNIKDNNDIQIKKNYIKSDRYNNIEINKNNIKESNNLNKNKKLKQEINEGFNLESLISENNSIKNKMIESKNSKKSKSKTKKKKMKFTLDLSDEGNITEEDIDNEKIQFKTEQPIENIIKKPIINSLSSLEDIHICNNNFQNNNFNQGTFYNNNNINNNKYDINTYHNHNNDIEGNMKADIMTLSSHNNSLKSQNSNYLINGSFSHYLMPDKNEQDINEYDDIQNSENFFSSFNNEQSNNSFSTSKFNNELNNETIISKPYKKSSHGSYNINKIHENNKNVEVNQNIDKLNKLKSLKVMQNKSQNNRFSENINKNLNNPFESYILNEIDDEQINKQTFNFKKNENINQLMKSIEKKNSEDIFDNLQSEENIFPLSTFQNNNNIFSKEIKNNQLNNNQLFSIESYKIDSSNINNNNNLNNNKEKRKKSKKDFKINSQIDENDFSDVDFLD